MNRQYKEILKLGSIPVILLVFIVFRTYEIEIPPELHTALVAAIFAILGITVDTNSLKNGDDK